MEEEIFLVEELENRLVIEAVNYKHRLDANWQTEQFDENYFHNFITGTLFTEFVTAIYDRIRPLNNHEINRYLTLSLAQFNTHTPEKREEAFVLNYWNTYWYPNVMEGKVNDYERKSAMYVLSVYKQYFHLFKEATEKAVADFKAGLAGTPPTQVQTPALQVQHEKLKTNLSREKLVVLFKMLSELKPEIFDIKTDTELFNFIAANFETKQTKEKGLSPGSIKNSFYSPDSSAADFWQKHLHDMLALARKYKGF